MDTKSFHIITAVTVVVTLIIFMVFCLVTKIIDKAKEPIKPESEQVIEYPKVVYRDVEKPNHKWMYRISKVYFEGHTYIVLEDTGTAILHDPDCQCQTQK